MADKVADTFDFITALMNAIHEGRIDAKTVRDMTPEQREEYKEKLRQEERGEIDEGLGRHREEQ